MDDRLRRLEQLALATPGDEVPRTRLRGELARLADVNDRLRWNAAGEAAQERVLAVLANLLSDAFTLEGRAVYRAGDATHRTATFRHRASGIAFQLVPGGTLRLGDDAASREDERPGRAVRLGAFLLGRFPLLQREWGRFPGNDERTWRGEELPIEGVSWIDAQAWLKRVGDGLRLPSEAEWEYACRAGTETAYFWGDAMDPSYCWFGGTHSWETHPPREHLDKPNAFGLIDMAGNVAEWCQDDYVAGYANASPLGAPRKRRFSLNRVLRGGDGFNSASYCRSGRRSMSRPGDRGAGIGFRVARSLPL